MGWYPYVSGPLGNNQWTVKGIYTDAAASQPEVFEPGIFNPGEELVVQLQLLPTIGMTTTNMIIIGTANGVTVPTLVNRCHAGGRTGFMSDVSDQDGRFDRQQRNRQSHWRRHPARVVDPDRRGIARRQIGPFAAAALGVSARRLPSSLFTSENTVKEPHPPDAESEHRRADLSAARSPARLSDGSVPLGRPCRGRPPGRHRPKRRADGT